MDSYIYVCCGCLLIMHDGAAVKPADLPEILVASDAKGQICTLASLDATVVIWPEGDESREVRIEMPDQGVTTSTTEKCLTGGEAKPLLVVTWSSSFQLCFYISKDEGNWNLDRIVFVYNSSEIPLGRSKSEIRMFASEETSLADLKAPIGRSYRCWAPKKFPLVPLGSAAMPAGRINDNATLLVSNFQLQPFLDDQKIFGQELVCSEDLIVKRQRRRRDSTVTIAVGSTLAVVAVVTVLGYAIFRHIKIKAVGYDTMQ